MHQRQRPKQSTGIEYFVDPNHESVILKLTKNFIFRLLLHFEWLALFAAAPFILGFLQHFREIRELFRSLLDEVNKQSWSCGS
jgi:hypothetical protein